MLLHKIHQTASGPEGGGGQTDGRAWKDFQVRVFSATRVVPNRPLFYSRRDLERQFDPS